MHGGCHCCHSETVSFVVSLLSRDVPCECSISECLAIVPLTRHQFRTKSGQFNGCLHACLHENILASENPEKRRAYSSAFSSKMWYSRVICVFSRWGLTYIWHVLWGKLSFNPKEAGSFDPISQPGGGGGIPPPPSDLGGGAAKNNVIWHIRKPCRNFYTENQSGFQIMQIYVNFMHMFICLIIFNKIRGFWVSKSFKYCHK